jgi:uncharacterized glyoxalase superfamily protein PhnB
MSKVWPILFYADAPAALRFLRDAFGFEEVAAYPDEQDPGRLVHAEMRWPGGGGVMFSSARHGDNAFAEVPPGHGVVYVVCDDPDGIFDRATGAGAEVELPLADEDYGSRGFTVRDPEGNLWSFGTYAGESAGQ